MRKKLTVDLDENPFIYIKIRSVFLWLFLAAILVAITQLAILTFLKGITSNTTIFNHSDPIYSQIGGIYTVLTWFAIVVYQFRRAGIDWSRLIGKVTQNYNWIPILFLALIRLLFSLGIWRVSYYPISFLFPDWFQSILINKDVIEAQNSFSPTIYYCLNYLSYFTISPLLEIFLFLIIFPYRLTSKYEKNKAILITCLIGGILGYNYGIGILVRTFIIIKLYFKSRTLIVPLVFILFNNFLYLIWNLSSSFFFSNDNTNLMENFQSQLPLGIFLVAISVPYLIYWLYKNRIKESDELPYFVNKADTVPQK